MTKAKSPSFLGLSMEIVTILATTLACGKVSETSDGAPDSSVDVSACMSCTSKIQHAMGTMCTDAGGCDYNSCAVGFGDFDGDRANGCESTLPNGVAEASHLVLWLSGDVGWDGQIWRDQSGGGRNGTVYTGTPGTATQNGRSVVNFNGGEILVNAGFPNWIGVTVMAVSNTSTDDALITMGVSYNPGCSTTAPAGAPGCVPYDQLAFSANMTLAQCDPAIGDCYGALSPNSPPYTWIRTVALEDPTVNPSFHSYFNGVDNGTLTHKYNYPHPTPWNTSRKDTIIGWRNYRGLLAEIIVFNVPISQASRLALDAYLATKWNVH